MWCLLLSDALPHSGDRSAAAGRGEAGRRPQGAFPVALLDVGTLLAQQATGHALEAVHAIGDGDLGRILDQQVNVIVLAVDLDPLCLDVGTDLGEDDPQPFDDVVAEHFTAIFCSKDQVNVHLENAVPSIPNIVCS